MTQNALLEGAREVVRKACAGGAQGVRAYTTRHRSASLGWRDGQLDRIRESTRLSVGVDLYVDGRYSSNSTSDLRPAALGAFLDECLAMTRAIAVDENRVLPDPQRYRDRQPGDLGLCDPTGMTPTERRRLVAEAEAAARAVGEAARIVAVESSAGDSHLESAMVVSNGMEGTRETTAYWLGTMVSVRDQGERKPAGWWSAQACRKRRLPTAASVGAEAGRRAYAELGAAPAKTGVYACVVENRVVPKLLGGLLGPLSGAAIQQRQSFLAGKLGAEVASPALTLTDDPLLVEGLDSRPYDHEGMTTRRRPIFDRGVLRGYFIDTYYGRKLGMAATSGSSTNHVFATGTRSLPELLAAMGSGILVTDFIGGNSNPATGDFSLGVRGFLVENGHQGRPILEMNLSGNHLSFWKELVEVGNDPFPYSTQRTPSFRLARAQFSGT